MGAIFKELKESRFSEYFYSFWNNYNDFLDSLTPDKIVCVFNIIIGWLTLSSFISIFAIMLSENIINRIKFLDKYPKILALLKIRNYINKKINNFYLFLHFCFWELFGNMYRFFLVNDLTCCFFIFIFN